MGDSNVNEKQVVCYFGHYEPLKNLQMGDHFYYKRLMRYKSFLIIWFSVLVSFESYNS